MESANYSNAVFAIADVLQLTLTKHKEKVTGKGQRKCFIGPIDTLWATEARVDTADDDGRVAALVKLRGHLWGYIYTDYGANPKIMWMVLFNGGTKDFSAFASGDVRTTLKKIEKNIVAAFEYDSKQEKWSSLATWDDLPT